MNSRVFYKSNPKIAYIFLIFFLKKKFFVFFRIFFFFFLKKIFVFFRIFEKNVFWAGENWDLSVNVCFCRERITDELLQEIERLRRAADRIKSDDLIVIEDLRNRVVELEQQSEEQRVQADLVSPQSSSAPTGDRVRGRLFALLCVIVSTVVLLSLGPVGKTDHDAPDWAVRRKNPQVIANFEELDSKDRARNG